MCGWAPAGGSRDFVSQLNNLYGESWTSKACFTARTVREMSKLPREHKDIGNWVVRGGLGNYTRICFAQKCSEPYGRLTMLTLWALGTALALICPFMTIRAQSESRPFCSDHSRRYRECHSHNLSERSKQSASSRLRDSPSNSRQNNPWMDSREGRPVGGQLKRKVSGSSYGRKEIGLTARRPEDGGRGGGST